MILIWRSRKALLQGLVRFLLQRSLWYDVDGWVRIGGLAEHNMGPTVPDIDGFNMGSWDVVT